ncbi:MAG: helix-turn-helix transcriptional regulator [Ruminococcaceae bacterium]|nr:helix-turn-helix transcriptional regulator [Oscillospiraceae bacterium]
MIINNQFFDDLRISDISGSSGVRAYGRKADHSNRGRKNNGILYIWSGEARFYDAQKEKVVASNGDMVFLPKHKKYKMEYTAESTTFVLANFELQDKNNDDICLFEDITILAKDDMTQRIAKTMMSFELCCSLRTIEATLRKKELMYRLFGLIYNSKPYLSQRSDIDLKIFDGVRLLEQTYLENLPISRYAEACHVSVNTFRSVFQKQFGVSPLKYRNHLRIERAKELLSEGGFTVAEVAYASGFENIGYFCRYFRQITGESPSETKRKKQNS